MSIYSPSQKSGVYVTAVPGVDLGGGSGSGADGATGATGPIGPAGNSVNIKGSYATLGALTSAHPSGNTEGDAYLVNANGHLYVWDGSTFVDLGPITGATGATGSAGSAGSNGATGATGAQGSSGNAGQPGATGATGAAGSAGSAGATGATGAQGATGANGTNGATGATGAQGATGAGTQGATGAAGSAGAQGATGATGSQGPVGATGAGSVGATGSTGGLGATGATGAQGTGISIKGSDTYANISVIGSPTDGDCWILTSTSGAPTRQSDSSAAQVGDGILRSSGAWINIGPLRGPNGATGSTGPQGATGAGSTGAAGPAGATGAQGATGATGGQGIDGATGATGSAGPAGATGAAGSAGAVGATGAAGSNGAVGATGAQGATGAAGSAGANGATGAQGATGSAGPAGATGAQGATGAGFTGATGPAGSGGGGAPLEPVIDKWKFSNASSGSPAAGYFRVSGSMASASIYINANSNTSVLRNVELSNIRVGQRLILRSVANPATEYLVFSVDTVTGTSPDISIAGANVFTSGSFTNDTEFTLSEFFTTLGQNGDLLGTWTWTNAATTTPTAGQFSTNTYQGSAVTMLYVNGVPKTSSRSDAAGQLTSLVPGDKLVFNESQSSLYGVYTVRDQATNISGVMVIPVVATNTNYHPWTNNVENSVRLIKGGGVKTISFTITGSDLVSDGSMDGTVAWKHEGLNLISLLGARAICKTAPTGSSAIINVLKNGSSVYTSSSNMPTISAGTTEGNYAIIGTAQGKIVQGDVLTIAVYQKGSTVAGKNLTLTVTYV